MSTNKSHKTWSFTLNNYTDQDKKLIEDWEKTYLCYGEEEGENGTPHLQGWITFKRGYRLTQLKKLHNKIHWEPGKCEDGANYCMKDKQYVIQNNRKQGSRTDIQNAINGLKSGGISQLIKEHPIEYIKYHTGFDKLLFHLMPKRKSKPSVHWRWGETGAGKTKYIYDNHDPDDVYEKDDTLWWDGYMQQQVVLIDDFRGNFKLNYLLKLLDRYPMKVQIKGGYIQFNSPIIYITSNKKPEDIYHNCGEDINQLLRRLETVTEVTKGNTRTLVTSDSTYDDYIF